MEKLRGRFSNDGHAEEQLGAGIEDQFQSSGSIAANLAASNLAEIGHTYFVRNTFVRQLLLRLSDERNFRDGVNPVGIIRAVGICGHAKRFGSGDASLLHGY